MSISRHQGYVNSRGIEAKGYASLLHWLDWLDLSRPRPITDKLANYRRGDAVSSGGVYLEQKTSRKLGVYETCLIEIAELTDGSNPLHADGAARTEEILDLPPGGFAQLRYRDFRTPERMIRTVGAEAANVSVSLTSISHADFTIFTQPEPGWVYLWERDELLALLRTVVRAQPLDRGKGLSNADTLITDVDCYHQWHWDGRDYVYEGRDLSVLARLASRWDSQVEDARAI